MVGASTERLGGESGARELQFKVLRIGTVKTSGQRAQNSTGVRMKHEVSSDLFVFRKLDAGKAIGRRVADKRQIRFLT
jgi:hypothetical protein